MAIHSATMSSSYSSPMKRSGFFRKLVISLSLTAGFAALMALLNLHQRNLSSFWMMVLAVLAVGLAAGSAARIMFFRSSGFVRFLVALVAVPLGMFLLGVFTVWQIGIGPLNPWFSGHIPQGELIELGAAFLVAMLVLEAWSRPAQRFEDGGYSMPRISGYSEPLPSPRSRSSVQARPSVGSSAEGLAYATPQRGSRLKFAKAAKTRSRGRTSSDHVVFARASARPSGTRRRNLFSRKPNLQISMYEEHRCPYCLEDVKRNDPRGVKKCEVCNTLHHADCWAITGFCQVPHLNT